jgi:hypothetical protein
VNFYHVAQLVWDLLVQCGEVLQGFVVEFCAELATGKAEACIPGGRDEMRQEVRVYLQSKFGGE